MITNNTDYPDGRRTRWLSVSSSPCTLSNPGRLAARDGDIEKAIS